MTADVFRAERLELQDSIAALEQARQTLAQKRAAMAIPYTTDRFIRSAEGAIGTALNILQGARRQLEPGSELETLGLERIRKS
jgi:hypothetical protein